MNSTLIINAQIVNEGKIFKGDVLIEGSVITEVSSSRPKRPLNVNIIDAKGKYLLPGIIDDQVHFREPGLTHKATIASESKAAVAGGITSFIEMPNTVPQATTQKLLQDKFDIASKTSYANYSFMFGGTNDNLNELLKTNPKKVAAIKLFLGSSTGNMLVDNEETLEKIFSSTKMLIAVHCEDEQTIRKNLDKAKTNFGDDIPIEMHPIIRSEEACYLSSSKAVALAKKTGARIHVFHLSTAKETDLFRNDIPLEEKQITAEVCIHHLWFDNSHYKEKGTLIKWNPAVKTAKDNKGLWKALLDDRIDVIATDHAPHTLEEKSQVYLKAPSGGPLVQHALLAMLETVHINKISLEKVVEKMCHNPAILFQIEKRGYIKKGYYADIVLVDLNASQEVTKKNLLYKCGWSPFEGTTFNSKITHTFVNGNLIYKNGKFDDKTKGMQLTFNR
jgi:dihydroorotase